MEERAKNYGKFYFGEENPLLGKTEEQADEKPAEVAQEEPKWNLFQTQKE